MSKIVLLIEDNPLMSENISELLELRGYKVVNAHDGKKGLLLLCEAKPDLVLCDVIMPQVDGFTVLHEKKKMDGKASIPFIFMTAKAEKSDIQRGMKMGADGYLTKPFSEKELFSLIEVVMQKKQSSGSD